MNFVNNEVRKFRLEWLGTVTDGCNPALAFARFLTGAAPGVAVAGVAGAGGRK